MALSAVARSNHAQLFGDHAASLAQTDLTANSFGDTVGRGGVDLAVRELLTFSMLVALGGADAQVRAHVSGNIKVGNDRDRLLAVLTVLVPFIGCPRTLNGLAALNDVTRS